MLLSTSHRRPGASTRHPPYQLPRAWGGAGLLWGRAVGQGETRVPSYCSPDKPQLGREGQLSPPEEGASGASFWARKGQFFLEERVLVSEHVGLFLSSRRAPWQSRQWPTSWNLEGSDPENRLLGQQTGSGLHGLGAPAEGNLFILCPLIVSEFSRRNAFPSPALSCSNIVFSPW